MSAQSTKKAEAEPKKTKRLPKSLRRYIRTTKATLRREHSPAEAEKAIQQLVQRVRQ